MPPIRRRFEALPSDWGRNEKSLWVNMSEASADDTGVRTTKFDVNNDKMLRTLYDTALYNYDFPAADRPAVMAAMRQWMRDKYDLDFDEVFDWEGYREHYDQAPRNLA